MDTYIMTPQKIAEVTGGRYIGSEAMRSIPVTGAVRDNREVKPGNLFVCIPGERTDGHLYANIAFDAGAACCLASSEIPGAKGPYVLTVSTLESIKALGAYHRSRFNIPVIGITGSVGKTTAKELTAAVLSAELNTLKTEKNLNNELGVPLTLMSLNRKHQAAVIEMGISGFGEMTRLAQMVRPDIFIITNIGYSHTKELGDLSGVLQAKTEAIPYMPHDGIVLVNGDDDLLRDYDPGIKKITFGLGSNCNYRAKNVIQKNTQSISMEIIYGEACFSVDIPAYGSHLASLAPAAAATGHLLGLTHNGIARGMSSYAHVEGRSNVSDICGITLINDSYNANPGSVKAALISLSQLTGRHVAILGDMLNLGSFSEELHYYIGSCAARCNIDLLLCCGTESLKIIDGFNAAGGSLAFHYPQFDLLIHDIPGKIKKGDAILVKASRGMQFERLLPVISKRAQAL